MRVLFANWDYEAFLEDFQERNPDLSGRSYAEQLETRRNSSFGMADFYSRNLARLGHECEDIFVNNLSLQRRWALENGIRIPADPFRVVPYLRRFIRPWFMRIVLEQVRKWRPDLLYVMCMGHFDPALLREIRPHVRLIAGQHASPPPRFADLSEYDIILSSLPNLVRFFRSKGRKAEYLRLGFEESLLDGIRGIERTIPISFVGGLGDNHRPFVKLLEYLCQHTEVAVWGYGIETLPARSPLRTCYRGRAFGKEMFRILGASKIAVNRHIPAAEQYANNMRLYEATGCGALLLTDRKENLHELFDVGKEVVAYGDGEECLQQARYYLEKEEERETMAAAGQERTLRDHTYRQRVGELIDILRPLL